jgi:hypothetical protein
MMSTASSIFPTLTSLSTPEISQAALCYLEWMSTHHRGLSGNLKMNVCTMVPNTTGNASGSLRSVSASHMPANYRPSYLQDAEETMYEQPNSSHRATMSPRPQKIPKLETCSPRLLAFAVSACQTLTVAMMPPVPRPRTTRETTNCENWKDVAMRMQPILWIRHDIQIVFRLPSQSPSQVQARAPNTPRRVYVATTVPGMVRS